MENMIKARHREHGGIAMFPESSFEAWASLGWEPYDGPDPEDQQPSNDDTPLKED